jgi:hypothetical protein
VHNPKTYVDGLENELPLLYNVPHHHDKLFVRVAPRDNVRETIVFQHTLLFRMHQDHTLTIDTQHQRIRIISELPLFYEEEGRAIEGPFLYVILQETNKAKDKKKSQKDSN